MSAQGLRSKPTCALARPAWLTRQLPSCMHIAIMHAVSIEKTAMAMLTVRNLPDEVHRALRARAGQHGRSMEAEVRAILESAMAPEGRLKLGSLLADIGRQVRLTENEFSVFEQVRDKSPARPIDFE